MQKPLIYVTCAVVIACGGAFLWQFYEAQQEKAAAEAFAAGRRQCHGAVIAFMNDRYVGATGDRAAVERCAMDGFLTDADIRAATASFKPLPNWKAGTPAR